MDCESTWECESVRWECGSVRGCDVRSEACVEVRHEEKFSMYMHEIIGECGG